MARRHWIPAAVVDITEEHIVRFRQEGYPIDDEEIPKDFPMWDVERIPYIFAYRFVTRAWSAASSFACSIGAGVFVCFGGVFFERVLLWVCPRCWEASEMAATMAKGQWL